MARVLRIKLPPPGTLFSLAAWGVAMIVPGLVLPALLAIHLSNDARPLGPRRVSDVIEGFTVRGYDLAAVTRGEARVPRLFLTRIPKNWRGGVPADKRKQAFVTLALPLILQANEHVYRDRQRLLDLAAQSKKGRKHGGEDEEWLSQTASYYETAADDLQELLLRVDVIPPSLALAQAAMESGWGTSRFATEGNALYGQWTHGDATAMLPRQRDPGADHAIRRFPTLADSVTSYLRNLNTHRAYAALRKARAGLRSNKLPLSGAVLARHLTSYSERGSDYVGALERMIAGNDLASFDSARLEGDAGPLLSGAQAGRP